MAGFGSAAKPHRRFGKVGGQRTAGRIQIADHRCRLGIARQRGPSQPRLALERICRDAYSLRKGKTPLGLRAPVAFERRLSVKFGCLRGIVRYRHAPIGQHRVKIQCRRQPLLGGSAQMMHHLYLHLGRRGIAGQSQGVPQMSLRAIAGSGLLVPTIRFGDIAQGFRSRPEDVCQYGLPLGRPTLRGFTRPFRGVGKIRLGLSRTAEQRTSTRCLGRSEAVRQTVQK